MEEIISNIEKFTNDEQDTINKIAAGEIEMLTPEEAELYARWKTTYALASERFQLEQKTRMRESQARIEQSQQIADAAAANLQAQADLARARLEAVQNGQI